MLRIAENERPNGFVQTRTIWDLKLDEFALNLSELFNENSLSLTEGYTENRTTYACHINTDFQFFEFSAIVKDPSKYLISLYGLREHCQSGVCFRILSMIEQEYKITLEYLTNECMKLDTELNIFSFLTMGKHLR